MRYGLTANTEIYGKTTWISDHARNTHVNGYETTRNNQFNDVWLGLNPPFIDEGNLPALLGLIEGAVAEKQTQSTSYGKSWLMIDRYIIFFIDSSWLRDAISPS